jgi:hypothetical protein
MLRASMPDTITATCRLRQPLQVAIWNETGLLVGYTQLNALTATASPAPELKHPCLENTRVDGSILFLDGCTISGNRLRALPAVPLPSSPDY